LKDLASSEKENEEDSDFESDHEWKGLISLELGKKLVALSCQIDDDDDDEGWIPYKLCYSKKSKKRLNDQIPKRVCFIRFSGIQLNG